MSRERHSESVDVAVAEVQALEHRLMAALEKHTEAMGAVVQAVGENTDIHSARNAFEFTAAIRERLEEVLRICENVKAELLRYRSGF